MEKILIAASDWMRPHIPNIALAIIATLMAIFGDSIRGWVKRQINQYNLFVRLLVFIALVTFGYGALTVLLAHVLAGFLARLTGFYLAPLIVMTFVLIGLLAEEKKKV